MQKITALMFFQDYTEFLPDAIDGFLKQTEPGYLVIIDSGTTGIPDEYAKQYPNITVRHVDKISLKYSNESIKAITTPYYIPICADDILTPDYFHMAQTILDENPAIDIVCSDVLRFGTDTGIWLSSGLNENIRHTNTMFCSSVCRKTLWEKLGGYDENLDNYNTMYDDWDFWARAYTIGAKAFHIPLPLYKWRVHGRNLSTHNPTQASAAMNYLRQKGVII